MEDSYIIISVYWISDLFDVSITGNCESILFNLKEYQVNNISDLLCLIKDIDNEVNEVIILINGSHFKKDFGKFIDSLYLINNEIKVKKMHNRKIETADDMIREYMKSIVKNNYLVIPS